MRLLHIDFRKDIFFFLRAHACARVLCVLTAVLVRVFVGPVPAVVDFVADFPLADAASVPAQELVRGARRTVCHGPK